MSKGVRHCTGGTSVWPFQAPRTKTGRRVSLSSKCLYVVHMSTGIFLKTYTQIFYLGAGCTRAMALDWRSENKLWRSILSYWVLGIELRSPCLVAGVFTCWATSICTPGTFTKLGSTNHLILQCGHCYILNQIWVNSAALASKWVSLVLKIRTRFSDFGHQLVQ